MKYQPLDIVMLRPDQSARIYAIVGLAPAEERYSYLAVRLDRGPLTKRYGLQEEHILAKIGVLDPGALQVDPAKVAMDRTVDYEIGQSYAEFMAGAPTEWDAERSALLARLEPGQCVPIRRETAWGVQVEHHRYQNVLPSGQKYRFAAMNQDGKVYRWTLEAIYLENEPRSG